MVLFDAVGTLWRPNPPVAVAYRQIARQHGVVLPEETIRNRFRAAFARQEAVDREQWKWRTSEQREEDRWREIVTEVFPEVHWPDHLFHDLWQHFAEPRHWDFFPEIPALIQALQQSGKRWGIASNFDRRLHELCRDSLPGIDAAWVFISSELGVRKPSPRFFELVAERLDVAPRDLLMIGDDPVNDMWGARQAGWNAILLDRLAAHTGIEPVVTSLDQLG